MSTAEIAKLEDAGRSAMVHDSEVYAGEVEFGYLLRSAVPIVTLVLLTAALMFAFW